jgi:hypothetical protein
MVADRFILVAGNRRAVYPYQAAFIHSFQDTLFDFQEIT